MSRIRTVKPEFWTDGKIGRISDSSALFFISLFNFSDDFGYFSCDTLERSLSTPRWRSQSIQKMLCSLADHGLIRLCVSLKVGLIVGWEHQKIKDRRASKWNEKEINWDEINIDAPRSDKIRPVLDRIGKDRIGKDRISSEDRKSPDPRPAVQTLGSKIFESYADAFQNRYGVEPTRNSKVNRHCQDIGTRLGEDAIEVAKFFLAHNEGFYLRAQHPVGSFLKDAESLHTQWKRGRSITSADVRSFEKTQNNQSVAERVAQSFEKEEV